MPIEGASWKPLTHIHSDSRDSGVHYIGFALLWSLWIHKITGLYTSSTPPPLPPAPKTNNNLNGIYTTHSVDEDVIHCTSNIRASYETWLVSNDAWIHTYTELCCQITCTLRAPSCSPSGSDKTLFCLQWCTDQLARWAVGRVPTVLCHTFLTHNWCSTSPYITIHSGPGVLPGGFPWVQIRAVVMCR